MQTIGDKCIGLSDMSNCRLFINLFGVHRNGYQTMKKRTNNPGVGRDVDLGSKAVETVQTAEVNQTTAVKIPRSQAVWVALPLSMAVVVTIISPIAIGQRIFYAVTGLCAFAAFLWSVQFEMVWQDRVSLPLLVGTVAWCLWRFTDWQGWRAPEAAQPFAAIFAVGSLVFWWTFTAAAWVTFWQRLGLPNFHQQYSIWRAVGALLEHWGKRERVQAQDAPDVEPPMSFEFSEAGRNGWRRSDAPQPRSVMVWIARILTEQTFSEANLCGTDKPLPGGVGGREQLAELRQWMIDEGLLEWNVTNGGGEPVPTQGVSLTSNGERWVEMVSKVRDEG